MQRVLLLHPSVDAEDPAIRDARAELQRAAETGRRLGHLPQPVRPRT